MFLFRARQLEAFRKFAVGRLQRKGGVVEQIADLPAVDPFEKLAEDQNRSGPASTAQKVTLSGSAKVVTRAERRAKAMAMRMTFMFMNFLKTPSSSAGGHRNYTRGGIQLMRCGDGIRAEGRSRWQTAPFRYNRLAATGVYQDSCFISPRSIHRR